jgi:hypothetical protein
VCGRARAGHRQLWWWGGSPAPGYTLTVATGLGTVTAGKSGSATLRLTPQNGYTGTVSLSCNVTGGSAASPSCALRAPSVAIDSAAVSVMRDAGFDRHLIKPADAETLSALLNNR